MRFGRFNGFSFSSAALNESAEGNNHSFRTLVKADLLYSIGFVMATGCLHAVGISNRLAHRWNWGQRALRVAGGAIAFAGLFFMWKVFA